MLFNIRKLKGVKSPWSGKTKNHPPKPVKNPQSIDRNYVVADPQQPFVSERLAKFELSEISSNMADKAMKEAKAQFKRIRMRGFVSFILNTSFVMLLLSTDGILTYFGAETKNERSHFAHTYALRDSLYANSSIIKNYDSDLLKLEQSYSSTLWGYADQINAMKRERDRKGGIRIFSSDKTEKKNKEIEQVRDKRAEQLEKLNLAKAELATRRQQEIDRIEARYKGDRADSPVTDSQRWVYLAVAFTASLASFMITTFGIAAGRILALLPQAISSFYNYFFFAPDESFRIQLGYYSELLGANYVSGLGCIVTLFTWILFPTFYSESWKRMNKALKKMRKRPKNRHVTMKLTNMSNLANAAHQEACAILTNLGIKLMELYSKEIEVDGKASQVVESLANTEKKKLTSGQQIKDQANKQNFIATNGHSIDELAQKKADTIVAQKLSKSAQDTLKSAQDERMAAVPRAETPKELSRVLYELEVSGEWEKLKNKYGFTFEEVCNLNEVKSSSNVIGAKNAMIKEHNAELEKQLEGELIDQQPESK